MQFFYLILVMALAFLAIFALRFLLRKKAIPLPIRILLPIAEIVFALTFAYLAMVIIPFAPRFVFVILMGAHTVTLIDGLVSVVFLIVEAIRRKRTRFLLLPILSFALTLSYASYGIVNMQIVTAEYVDCTSAKILRRHSFVFLADLHVGSAQPFSLTEKTIREAGKSQVDFFVLGGDIVDAYTSKEEMRKTFALFGEIGVPVYFIHGNHEITDPGLANFTFEEMVLAAKENGIRILEDEFVPVDEDLLLLGRMDLASNKRKGYRELVNPNPSSFLLTIDHQPTDFPAASAFGVDLQLSGHTHNGQLFPLGWLYYFATYPQGDFWNGSSRLFVTHGASGWATPLRTQGHCHYEIVRLSPKA